MKRILLVSNKMMHYRVPVYNYFARRFLEEGYELHVRADEMQRQSPHAVEFDFREIPFDFRRYAKETEELDPDFVILFVHVKDLMLWPYLHWLKARRIPAVWWTKGANLDDAGNATRHLVFRYLHRTFDGIILYSEHELSYIHPRNRFKVSIAPNTLNFESFPDLPQDRAAIKRKLGIPFEKMVLFVGRMGISGERKKVDHVVEVFRRISRSDWGLVIVGSGMPDVTRIRLNPANTRYLGEVHDPEQRRIGELFTAADLFCIPGHVGLGLVEAFFRGLPVVTEEGKQPPEVHYLVDGRNGFIVPEDDVDALYDRIVNLLDDDETRRTMSVNARHDILEHAGIERMFQGFLQGIQRLDARNGVVAVEASS